jgi:hypothetical protein
MKEKNNEQKFTNIPEFVTINGTEKILNQMKFGICKIYGGKGTGFFCKFSNENKQINVLVTNYHIINEAIIKKKQHNFNFHKR